MADRKKAFSAFRVVNSASACAAGAACGLDDAADAGVYLNLYTYDPAAGYELFSNAPGDSYSLTPWDGFWLISSTASPGSSDTDLHVRVGVTPHMHSNWEGPYEIKGPSESIGLVPVAAANLPDGRLLTWASASKLAIDHYPYNTVTAIFDPSDGSSTDAVITNVDHNMFCPGTSMLPDGKIHVGGGYSSANTSIYDPDTHQWTGAGRMVSGRGYQSQTVTSDGSILTMGGSFAGGVFARYGEIWRSDTGQWDQLDNVVSTPMETEDQAGQYRSDNHMWLFEAPNGSVFQAGPSRKMHWIDYNGEGDIIVEGNRADDDDAMNGNAVMIDVGMIFTTGGAPDYQYSAPVYRPASERAYVIDVNAGVGMVDVLRLDDMAYARAHHYNVVLPSGEVVIVGGQAKSRLFEDRDSAMAAEIWDPVTGLFTTMAEMTVPRNYHGVAILLKDGRVAAGGGGLCGDCNTNHPDMEVFTPPYLYQEDEQGQFVPATRPVILQAPAAADRGDVITVKMDTADSHDFVLMRMGIATHSINTDVRRIPLESQRVGGDTFSVDIPAQEAIVLPGSYFLFALNSDGVPSVATVLSIAAD